MEQTPTCLVLRSFLDSGLVDCRNTPEEEEEGEPESPCSELWKMRGSFGHLNSVSGQEAEIDEQISLVHGKGTAFPLGLSNLLRWVKEWASRADEESFPVSCFCCALLPVFGPF